MDNFGPKPALSNGFNVCPAFLVIWKGKY